MIEKYLYFLDENSIMAGQLDISYPDKAVSAMTEAEKSDLIQKGYSQSSLNAGRLFYPYNPNESTMVQIGFVFDSNTEYALFDRDNQIWSKQDIQLTGIFYKKLDGSLHNSIAKKDQSLYVQKTEEISLLTGDTLVYNETTGDFNIVAGAERLAKELADAKLAKLAELKNLYETKYQISIIQGNNNFPFILQGSVFESITDAANKARTTGFTYVLLQDLNGYIYETVNMPAIFINENYKDVNMVSQSNYQAYTYYQILINIATDISTVNAFTFDGNSNAETMYSSSNDLFQKKFVYGHIYDIDDKVDNYFKANTDQFFLDLGYTQHDVDNFRPWVNALTKDGNNKYIVFNSII